MSLKHLFVVMLLFTAVPAYAAAPVWTKADCATLAKVINEPEAPAAIKAMAQAKMTELKCRQ